MLQKRKSKKSYFNLNEDKRQVCITPIEFENSNSNNKNKIYKDDDNKSSL